MTEKRRYKYIGLFLFIIAFITYTILLLLTSAPTIEVYLSPIIYWSAFVLALIGLGLGFLGSITFKFYSRLLVYIIGQGLVTIILLFLVRMPVPYDDYDAAIAGDTLNTSMSGPDTGTFAPAIKTTYEQVLYRMEEEYPLGAYELLATETLYINGDTTGNSGVTCIIVFSLKDEDNKKYISKYLVTGGVLAPVYIKKDTTSAEYRDFMNNSILK